MIPTMLVAGVLVGRGWAVPSGVLVWGALLLATGSIGLAEFPLAALLGGANAAVGVILRRAVGWPLRRPPAIS